MEYRAKIAVTAAAVIVLSLGHAATTCQAGTLFIAGSPGYDETTGNGFQGGEVVFLGSGVNNNGVAVGYSYCYEAGTEVGNRAVRWDGSGTAAVELGNLGAASDGVTYVGAHAVNNAGTAVGYAWKYVDGVDKGPRAVRWDADGTAATELDGLGTTTSGHASAAAHAVNDDGTVVGTAGKYVDGISQGSRAVRWNYGGTTATELGNLGTSSSGYTEAVAWAVNGAGTAVGRAAKVVDSISKGSRAVRWDAGTTLATELDNLGTDSNGLTYAYAEAVNNAGMAVGYARKYVDGENKGDRAVRWDAGDTAATELGYLGATSAGYAAAHAYIISDVGTAIGYSYKFVDGNNKGTRAVRWDASGTDATELGNLGTDVDGVTKARAYDINETGTVVGYSEKYVDGVNVGSRAVIWLPDASVIDLNNLGISPTPTGGEWTLNTAKALSADGWVAGVGTFDPDGDGPLDSYERLWVAQVGLGGAWTNGTGGTWGRGPNWSTGTPAMQVGEATFDLEAAYTVSLDRDEVTRRVDVRAGAVTLELAGHVLEAEDGFTIAEGATLRAAGSLVGELASAGTLEFEIAGPACYDAMELTGEFTTGGIIAVRFAPGYCPTGGESFDLMDVGAFVDAGYVFDFDAAALAPGLAWNTSAFAATGTITVVPEPGAVAGLWMLGVGFLTGTGRRRNTD